MAAIEDRVLTELLTLGSLQPAFKHGLTEKHFMDFDRRQIFEFMRNYWNNPTTARTLPTFGRIRKKWPSFQPTALSDEADTLPRLINELKMRSLQSDTLGMADYFRELAEDDPVEAVHALKAGLRDLEIRTDKAPSPPIGLQGIAEIAREQYYGAKSGVLYGIPWPWKCLTEDTLGKRPGDFIVLYGRMKSLKTWIATYCAGYDFLVNKRRVAFWSKEMSKEKLGLRMAGTLAGVDYHLFKAGCLPPQLEERTFRILDQLSQHKTRSQIEGEAELGVADIMLMAGRGAPKTLDDLKDVVEEFQPDIVYLDSFYHIDSSRSGGLTERWKRVSALAEDVKEWAEELTLPVVAVHQANRFGEKTYGNTLADMADADVIAREADLIIRVVVNPAMVELHEEEYEKELTRLIIRARNIMRKPKYRPTIKLGKSDPRRDLSKKELIRLKEKIDSRRGAELALVPGGNREGILPGFIIRAVPAYDFRVIDENPSMSEIKKWVKEDDTREDSPKGKKSKKAEEAAEMVKALANSLSGDHGAGPS
jgi:replicative DNA helicase